MAKRRTHVRKQPQQSRSQVSVDAILVAALRVLEQEGLAKLTTIRIAEVAGVSVGTLYQYFPSKEAILGVLNERRFDDVFALLRQLLEQTMTLPIETAVGMCVRGVIEHQQSIAALHAPFFESLSSTGRTTKFREYLARFVALVAEYLERRRADLRITDFETAAFVLVHSSEGVTQGLAYAPHDNERLIAECTYIMTTYLVGPKP